MSDDDRLTLAEAAELAGVTPATLKRWAASGVIPEVTDSRSEWTPAAVSHARIVARLRARGHSLGELARGRRGGQAGVRLRGGAVPLAAEAPLAQGRRRGRPGSSRR